MLIGNIWGIFYILFFKLKWNNLIMYTFEIATESICFQVYVSSRRIISWEVDCLKIFYKVYTLLCRISDKKIMFINNEIISCTFLFGDS